MCGYRLDTPSEQGTQGSDNFYYSQLYHNHHVMLDYCYTSLPNVGLLYTFQGSFFSQLLKTNPIKPHNILVKLQNELWKLSRKANGYNPVEIFMVKLWWWTDKILTNSHSFYQAVSDYKLNSTNKFRTFASRKLVATIVVPCAHTEIINHWNILDW